MLPLFRKRNDKLECLLCPHFCKIAAGKSGICGVRKNTGDIIELQTYGLISGFSTDPIEKKPLYHFFPGNNILSIGSYGCNLRCDFCQNFNISQNIPETRFHKKTPESIINTALSTERNIGIAFTYNEPVISFEYMKDVATIAKDKGLYTVMVSNGFVNPGPMSEIIQFIDAFNIDLKAFTSTFYKKLTGADIEPVKLNLKKIAESGRHLEITTLIIPGQNDDKREMDLQSKWIAAEVGKDVPLHLSRYFPMYRRDDPATSQETLSLLYEVASDKLDYVYVGNTKSDFGQNTLCPKCRTTVTIRSGYNNQLLNLTGDGKCTGCGNLIYKHLSLTS